MEYINLAKEKTSIVIPFKSGHTLLYTTFIHLFKHYKIDFVIETETDNFLENVQVFVRNPLNRFFSSYTWLEEMSINGDEKVISDILNYKKSVNISDLNSYIKNYNDFTKLCDNYHFLPQTTQILYSTSKKIYDERKGPFFDIKHQYDVELGPNYKIFKLEDVDNKIKINNNILIQNSIGFLNKFENTGFNSNIETFDFLKPYGIKLDFMFMVFYTYFKNFFNESGHHKNQTYLDKISEEEFCIAFNLVKSEFDFFGYKPNDIDVEKLKRL